MNTALILIALAAAASAGPINVEPKVVRAPEHDSAIIQSHRLGGNFAYSTHEAHAYGVETPIVKERVVQKGVSFHEGTPVVSTKTAIIKKQVPQYGIVKKQHVVPTVQYSAPIHTVHQQVKTIHQQQLPITYSGPSAVQYAYPAGYVAGVTPIQYHALPNFQVVKPIIV